MNFSRCIYAIMLVLSAQDVRAQQPPVHADMALVNARILTMEDDQSSAEALAVKHGMFLQVGSNEEVQALTGPETDVIDAGGRTAVPGFIDAHLHPGPIHPDDSPLSPVPLGPDHVSTIDELIEALRRKAAITPMGMWVRGSRYQDTKLGRHPTRHDLDRASTGHPILITHSSGHVSSVNTMALEAAGIAADTPDPDGGGFDREPGGFPNGVCREGARSMVYPGTFDRPEATREQEVEGLLRCFEAYVREGITSVHDAGVSPGTIRLYQDARAAGQPVRVNLMVRERHLDELKALGLRSGFGDDYLRIGPIKMFHGNSLSGRTCWLCEPYDRINPETGEKDYYGIPPARSQEDLDRLILEIHEAGFQAAVHSNGDREIDMVLDAFENALDAMPREDHRHRIEHASVVNDRILERAKRLGVVLALHSYIYEHGDKMDEYGERRWGMMHANRSALDRGIAVAGNSDSPVSAADPMLRVQSLVTRTTAEGKTYGPEQRLSVEEALRVWTMGGAYAGFEEDVKGSIKPGKLADFVLLSRNPLETPPPELKDIDVVLTVIGGRVVYRAGE